MTDNGAWIAYDASTGHILEFAELRDAMNRAAPKADEVAKVVGTPQRTVDLQGSTDPRSALGLTGLGAGTRGAGTEAVFGNTDDRQRVTDTTSGVYRAVAHLLMTFADGSEGLCSGSFVRPRVVLTAGHCVFQATATNGKPRGVSGWARTITVVPAHSGNSAPFGYQASTVFLAGQGWVSNASFQEDWGLVILPDTSLHQRIGGVYSLRTFNLRANDQLAITGYPADKGNTSMWVATGRILGLFGTVIRNTVDMMAGESGGPCWTIVRVSGTDLATIVGVNSHEQYSDVNRNGRFDWGIDVAAYNGCTAVTDGMVQTIRQLP